WRTSYPRGQTLNPDLSKAYEVLGVKPGVSMRELKAAHRDLAKVWHPDRFLHDPRLQEKAQEKLKEINEAYEQISSGKVPKPVNPPPHPPQTVHHSRTIARHGSNWQWAAIFLLVFAAVFAITTRNLLQQRSRQIAEEPQLEEPANTDQAQPTRPDSNTRAEVRNGSQRSNTENETSEVTSPVSIPAEPLPAVATVTVTIDPETGLLAKPECPLRSRMTYPTGSQPTGYCNLSHAQPKESRIKSIAKSVKRTLD
ncbi:MAG TPA: J domain-containing protein, partial [Pyrinomonadaceae bacterium]|nr:J domain-containing protein [Pyrinomonadaceae bacterium]